MLEILYQDEHIVAINKPGGLLVHRSAIDRHETRFALQLLRDQLEQHVYPVHRLDKPTSGVLVFALSSEMARELSLQFEAHSITKNYLSVVRGYSPERGVITHPLKEKFDKMTDRQRKKDKPAQDAETHFQRIATVEIPFMVDRYPQSRYSLISAQPVTGRKHQIRRHFKHIGHPIIGDAKHGKGVHNRFFKQQYQCDRLLLACTSMSFSHPMTNETLTIKAKLDEMFLGIVTEMGWKAALDDYLLD